MKISSGRYDEKFAIMQLNAQYKQGYCTVPALVTFLRNDYRDLTLEKAVEVVNKWIDEYKIKHEHLAVAYSKRLCKNVVVLKSVLEEVKRRKQQ